MNRNLAWIVPLVLPLAACFEPSSDAGTDAAVAADVASTLDAVATGTCTTHRDCFANPQSDKNVCDPATGRCVTPGIYLMPCDTDADCKTWYNTSQVTCTDAKVCASPCREPGVGESSMCPYGERSCSFQGDCRCTTDAKCGNGQVCGTVSYQCMSKCQADLDCAALTGTHCDTATGQCVK